MVEALPLDCIGQTGHELLTHVLCQTPGGADRVERKASMAETRLSYLIRWDLALPAVGTGAPGGRRGDGERSTPFPSVYAGGNSM